MTIVTDWCGDESYRNTKFRMAIPAGPTFDDADEVAVVGISGTACGNTNVAWDPGASLEETHLTVCTDEAVSLRIKRIGSNINSFEVYPERFRELVSAAVSDNDLVVVIPGDGTVPFLYLEVNGIRREGIHIRINPLDPTVPGGAISLDEAIANGQIDPGQVVYADAGVYELPGTPPQFPCGNGSRLILKVGALVVGNFSLAQAADAEPDTIVHEGGGVVTGEFADPEDVGELPFEEAETYSFYKSGAPFTSTGIAIRGITYIRPAYWFNRGYAPNTIERVSFLNKWWWGIGAQEVMRDSATGASSMDDCFAFNHDDTFGVWFLSIGNRVDTRCFALTASGAGWNPGFVTQADVSAISYVQNGCDFMTLNDENPVEGSPTNRFSAAVKVWFDDVEAHATFATPPCTFNDLRVNGPIATRWIVLENLTETFLSWPVNDSAGCVANFTFNACTTPASTNTGKPIRLWGRDADNTPHHITFHDCFIGDVQLTEQNKNTFVDFNSFVHDLVFDEGVVLESIVVTPEDPELDSGDSTQLTATGTDSDGDESDLTEDEDILWSSSNPVVATVSNAPGTKGLVAALSAGEAVISATYVPDTEIVGSVTVTVTEQTAVADAPFNVEDGSGVEDANAYCTVEFADAYHLQYGNPTAWSGATQAEREDAIRDATRAADEAYAHRWFGDQTTNEQALAWPRNFVLAPNGDGYLDEDAIPLALQRWTARYALLHINGEDISPETQSDADVRSESKSGAGFAKSVTYAGAKTAIKRFPALERMLVGAGLIRPAAVWGVMEQ